MGWLDVDLATPFNLQLMVIKCDYCQQLYVENTMYSIQFGYNLCMDGVVDENLSDEENSSRLIKFLCSINDTRNKMKLGVIFKHHISLWRGQHRLTDGAIYLSIRESIEFLEDVGLFVPNRYKRLYAVSGRNRSQYNNRIPVGRNEFDAYMIYAITYERLYKSIPLTTHIDEKFLLEFWMNSLLHTEYRDQFMMFLSKTNEFLSKLSHCLKIMNSNREGCKIRLVRRYDISKFKNTSDSIMVINHSQIKRKNIYPTLIFIR